MCYGTKCHCKIPASRTFGAGKVTVVYVINVFTQVVVADFLVAATKEIGLEVNADKTKYMVTSRDQNAG